MQQQKLPAQVEKFPQIKIDGDAISLPDVFPQLAHRVFG